VGRAASLLIVAESVRVTRGGQTHTYVVAEEHDDGSLLLRPEAVLASNGSSATDGPVELRRARDDEVTVQVGPRAPGVPLPGVASAGATEIDAILEVSGLSVSYGRKRAVADVSFEIGRGEIFGLLGPNGAGKTSTLSAIEGLINPQTGSVLLDGLDVRRHPVEARARMGVQLQATSFQSELSIRQIVRLYAGLYGMRLSDAEITDNLRAIGLDGEAAKPFKQLSGGQQQRLALYIAVVHEPLLLLLDEPTAGLDPQDHRQRRAPHPRDTAQPDRKAQGRSTGTGRRPW
jgi:ABC-type lipopolysaccharide export system ATPase subunit